MKKKKLKDYVLIELKSWEKTNANFKNIFASM